MTADRDPIAVGRHRPVYLWAGPGTIRMNRLKFMGAPVDEAVHLEAHRTAGAQRMVAEAGFNWIYLTYDWGFPPEVERQDWEAFRQTVPIYHAGGARVFGYVQTSNCVYDGSFRTRDWYARDPRGRPFYYYTGRYMTCWLHPDWRQHLRDVIGGMIEAGADGVFLDNPWHGAQPFLLSGAWLGPAGCYCPRCQAAFRQATGLDIPAHLDPSGDETSRRYLRWRADVVAQTIGELAGYARSLKPDVVVSANDFDAVMRPSYLMLGIDLEACAQVQDVLMIEDYGLPRWEPGQPSLLVNNALTLRTARALAGETPVTTDPYDKGIGFDGVYPPRRFRQGMAEAAACGVPMVVKGTEFVENGVFTLLSAPQFAPQRQAIGHYHRWLEAHAALYQERTNLASVGLCHPGERLWLDWGRLAPLYFGAGQALLAAGIPWRVVARGEQPDGLEVLLTFASLPGDFDIPPGVRVIHVPDLAGWEPARPSLLARNATLRRGVAFGAAELYRAYFRYRWARSLLDRAGLAHFFLQSPYYRLPSDNVRQMLLDALGAGPWPRLDAQAPVLLEWWAQGDTHQVHLVNYADSPQPVRLDFGRMVSGRVLSPDSEGMDLHGESLALTLDVYAVILLETA